jgi:pilus assembly protein FimV
VQKKILSSLILASALPFNVHALGLGDIEIYSALNQPLDAEISIVAAKPGEADSLLVKLASEQAFLKSGVERPFMLTKLKFRASYKADGTPIIKVTSHKAIREPFLNFLVDVEWPRGRLVREYTLLLDPPSFSTAKPVTTAAPAVTAASAVTGSTPIEREAPADTGVYGFTEPEPSTAVEDVVAEEVATYQEPVEEVVEAADEQAALLEETLGYDDPLPNEIETVAVDESLGLEPQSAVAEELEESASPFSDLVDDIQGEESVEFDENAFAPAAGEPSVDAYESPVASLNTEDLPLGDELPEISLNLDETIPFNAESILAADHDYVDPEIEALLSADAAPLYRESAPEPEVVYVAPEPVAEERPNTHTVEQGDIMLRIAEQFRPRGVDINQAMLAIMRYNPEAFIQENVNLVRKGQVLRIPDAEAMRALSNGDALSEVQGQNALWREYRAQLAGAQSQASETASSKSNASGTTETASTTNTTQLALVAPGKDDESSNFSAGEQEGSGDTRRLERNLALAKEKLVASNLEQTELQSRINELEQIVTQSEGVINLKSQQLAQIQASAEQANAAAEEVAQAVDATMAAEPAGVAEIEGDLLEGIDGVDESDVETTDVAVAEEESAVVAEIDESVAVATAGTARPDGLGGIIYDNIPPSLRSSLLPILDGPLLLVILALPILIILVVVFLMTRKSKQEPEIVFTDEDLGAAEEPAVEGDAVDATVSMDSSDMDEDMEATMVSSVAETVLSAPEVEAEPESVDDDIQDDTTAEVDVYIAYGLHDQAEELLKQSITDNPDITAYRGKLLETYFNAGKKDEFIAEAQSLHDSLAGRPSKVWGKAVVMGKEIAPDNMLFSDAEVSGDLKASDFAAAKPDMADLDIGADIDLGGDDIDLSAAELDDDDTVAESLEEDEFSLDDVAAELDASLDEEPEEVVDDGELEFDVADFIENDEEEAAVEVESDEMDIDVADFMEEPDELGEPDLNIGMDLDVDIGLSEASEESDLDMDFDLGGDEVDLDIEADLGSDDEASAEEFDLGEGLDLSDDLGMDLDAPAEELAADDGIDFDMGDFDISADEESSNNTMGLDDDAFDDAADSTQMIDDESLETMIDDMDSDEADFGLDDDMPDNLDEVGTKLDLAKAYIDMGDADGAKASLEEVIQEGSSQQKKEAEELLAQI